ncbi:MAG: hypothetical protein AVDCRST_MAG42-15, partial [uncultured Chthoniobacterales bacterium]
VGPGAITSRDRAEVPRAAAARCADQLCTRRAVARLSCDCARRRAGANAQSRREAFAHLQARPRKCPRGARDRTLAGTVCRVVASDGRQTPNEDTLRRAARKLCRRDRRLHRKEPRAHCGGSGIQRRGIRARISSARLAWQRRLARSPLQQSAARQL